MSDPSAGEGTVIGGRYHLVRQVAGGGMGDVWRARDDRLGRDVAVKLLKSHLADDQVFRLRFRNEALAAAALNHSAIASVFDYGELTSATRGPLAYLVMEFVEGESLEQVLRRQGGLDPASTLELVAQVSSGLQAAHDTGIVHRDIKPANVMVRPDGTVKITDFGIARLRDDQQLTQTGTMLGTVEYMSPEQLAGGSATGRSDIYALGVVAYRCLAGRTPFSAPESMAVALAHVNDPVPPMPAEVPGPAVDLVLRMLEKDPAGRPPSAGAVTEQADSALLLLGDAGFDDGRVAPTGPGGTGGTEGQMAATEVVRGDLTAPMPAVTELHDGPAGPVSGRPSASAGRADRRWRSKWAVAIAAALVVALVAAILWAAAGPGPVSLPDLKGAPVATAEARLGALGLKAGIRTADHAATSAGTVLDQHPVAGSHVPAGTTVALTVASGFVDLTATSLVGEAASTAKATVTAQGLRVSTSSVVSTATPGTVVSVSPSGRLPLGASVTVGVAVAPPVPTTTAPPPGPGGKQPGGSGKGH